MRQSCKCKKKRDCENHTNECIDSVMLFVVLRKLISKVEWCYNWAKLPSFYIFEVFKSHYHVLLWPGTQTSSIFSSRSPFPNLLCRQMTISTIPTITLVARRNLLTHFSRLGAWWQRFFSRQSRLVHLWPFRDRPFPFSPFLIVLKATFKQWLSSSSE